MLFHYRTSEKRAVSVNPFIPLAVCAGVIGAVVLMVAAHPAVVLVIPVLFVLSCVLQTRKVNRQARRDAVVDDGGDSFGG